MSLEGINDFPPPPLMAVNALGYDVTKDLRTADEDRVSSGSSITSSYDDVEEKGVDVVNGPPPNLPAFLTPAYNALKAMQRFLGFHKAYNIPLWIIFGGAMTAFCISRMPYYNKTFMLDHIGLQNWYWFHQQPYRFGLYFHLATALPGGVLVPLQFVPAIRYKNIMIHRIIGYYCIFMIVLACAGGFTLARRVLSGDPAGDMHTIILGATPLFELLMAWINIKRLQIDEHRKWMLRAWCTMGAIVSTRLIFQVAPKYIDKVGTYSITYSCDNVLFDAGGNSTLLGELFPACLTAPDLKTFFVAVPANSRTGGILGYVATLRLSYTLCNWLKLTENLIAAGFISVRAEVYIHLTAAESERLRIVSYHKQLERGFKHPGSAGITADRIGDAHWTPPVVGALPNRV
ncbi:uncharacterized protein EI90DRAFT_2652747 [Cantharellus anzutake]|uniref:uncharacterized protein n=1 Tax=Cantharellus anzutake TaxID=1750568 RepID=UPI0019063A4C|nr:uncharacterized protein EI90DRAFT_2652747 [Cantharellus anzutake]KAF8337447.1 hypothetical protein EI90DRAFT_2652747 [Cantharellus anzutake]